MNKQLQTLRDNWVLVSAVGILVLLPYLKGVVGEVMTEDLGTTKTITDMKANIAANTDDIEDHDDDVARIETKIDALGLKMDRLVEIMLQD